MLKGSLLMPLLQIGAASEKKCTMHPESGMAQNGVVGGPIASTAHDRLDGSG